MGRRKVTPEIEAKLTELAATGMTDKSIAKALDIHANTVAKYRKKIGITKDLAAAKHTERLKFYQQGLNDTQIARELGCSTWTVAQWRKKNGLERNRSRKKAAPSPRTPGSAPRSELKIEEQTKPKLPAPKAVISAQEKCVVIQQAVQLREGAPVVVVDRAGGGKKAAIYQGTVRFVNTYHFTVDIGGYGRSWQWSDVQAGIVRIA